jgi:hypothetical protein
MVFQQMNNEDISLVLIVVVVTFLEVEQHTTMLPFLSCLTPPLPYPSHQLFLVL